MTSDNNSESRSKTQFYLQMFLFALLGFSFFLEAPGFDEFRLVP